MGLLCKNEMESRDHFYFLCPYTEVLWKGLLGKLLGTRYSNQWYQIQQILVRGSCDETTMFLVHYDFQLAVYFVWRQRIARQWVIRSFLQCSCFSIWINR